MNHSSVDFVGILFFGVLLLGAALNIYASIYNAFSHSGGNKKNLRRDAKIMNVKQYTVGGKNSKKIRTEVLFDDGFGYVSHKTDREDSFLSYRIQVTEETKERILNDAMEAHRKACVKAGK